MNAASGSVKRRSLFWIHPQLRDYRLALFTAISRKHDTRFFFQIDSDTSNDLMSTTSSDSRLRRVSISDLRHLISSIRATEVVLTSFLWSTYSIVAIVLAKVFRKRVIVWEEQSHQFPGARYRVKRVAMRLLAGATDAFFVLGAPQRAFLIELGVPCDRIFVANEYPGIHFGNVPAKPTPLPFQDQPVVLFIGRLIEVKGVSFLLRAMKELDAHLPNVGLLIVGDGPLRGSLEHESLQLGLSNVHFAGWVNDAAEKSYLLSVCALLAAPSVIVDAGEAEGGPLVVLEALSAGRPVVGTTSLGSSTSFIEDGVNGYIVAERDPTELCDAMRRVLADTEGFAARTVAHFRSIPGHEHQVDTIERAIDLVAPK